MALGFYTPNMAGVDGLMSARNWQPGMEGVDGLMTAPGGATGTFDPTPYKIDPNQYRFASGGGTFRNPMAPINGLDVQYNYNNPMAPINGLDAQYNFTAPSGQALLSQDPGYQWRLEQGRKALEAGAASKGGLLSGGTQKALVNYGQNLASQEYSNAYGRALGENQLRYARGQQYVQDVNNQALLQNQMNYERGRQYVGDVNSQAAMEDQVNYGRDLAQNQMDWERMLQSNQLGYGRDYQANQDWYNRAIQDYMLNYNTGLGERQQSWNELMGLANLGMGAQGQLTQGGQVAAGQMGNNITGAGAAQAAGQIGASNAWVGALSGLGGAANQYLQYSMLQDLLRRPQAAYTGVAGGGRGY